MGKEIIDTLRSLTLSRKQLRLFGIVGVGMTGLLLFRFPHLLFFLSPLILWFILGVVAPRTVFPLYYILMALTLPIGGVVSRAFLTVFFYGVLTPFSYFRWWRKQDPLHLRFQGKNEVTYWEEVETNTHHDKMYV